MHFLVYVPWGDEPAGRTLSDAGLGDFAADAESTAIGRGPDGRRGTLYGWRRPSDDSRDFGYFPDRQEWVESRPAGRYWLGFYKGRPPGPGDLIRKPAPKFHGTSVALGDGHPWIVPAAERLPRTLAPDLADDGAPRFVLAPSHDAYFAEAGLWIGVFSGQVPEPADAAPRLFRFALDALRMNYRVTAEVAARLGLLHPQAMVAVAAAAADVPTYEEIEQAKKDLGAVGTPVT